MYIPQNIADTFALPAYWQSALCVGGRRGTSKELQPWSWLQVSAPCSCPCCCYTRVRGLDCEMRLLTVSSCSGQSLVSPGVDQPRPRHLWRQTLVLTVKGAQLAARSGGCLVT